MGRWHGGHARDQQDGKDSAHRSLYTWKSYE
jgi:hypothetical protein